MEFDTLVKIILIAIGLAMDAFAVSITSGTIMKRMQLRHTLRIALFFGLFQGIMPLIGWLLGSLFQAKIQAYDHWIAFILLAVIGGKMIYESFQEEGETFDPLDISVLFSLSIATSIDALAVGITFSLLQISVITAAMIIGVITFVLSLLGVYLGDYIGKKVGNKVEILGGVILIGIGLKILIEHTLIQ